MRVPLNTSVPPHFLNASYVPEVSRIQTESLHLLLLFLFRSAQVCLVLSATSCFPFREIEGFLLAVGRSKFD